MENHQYKKAIRVCEQLINQNENDILSLIYKADCLVSLEKVDSAFSVLSSALLLLSSSSPFPSSSHLQYKVPFPFLPFSFSLFILFPFSPSLLPLPPLPPFSLFILSPFSPSLLPFSFSLLILFPFSLSFSLSLPSFSFLPVSSPSLLHCAPFLLPPSPPLSIFPFLVVPVLVVPLLLTPIPYPSPFAYLLMRK